MSCSILFAHVVSERVVHNPPLPSRLYGWKKDIETKIGDYRRCATAAVVIDKRMERVCEKDRYIIIIILLFLHRFAVYTCEIGTSRYLQLTRTMWSLICGFRF